MDYSTVLKKHVRGIKLLHKMNLFMKFGPFFPLFAYDRIADSF